MITNNLTPIKVKAFAFSKVLLIMLFANVACSEKETEFFVQDVLQKHVDAFYYEASLRGLYPSKDNAIIKLKKGLREQNKAFGLTRYEIGYNADPQVEIWIDEDYFYNSAKSCVESTIFHELGHGILKRDHNNGYSIMNTHYRCYGQDYSSKDTTNYRNSLLNELFTDKAY